MGVMLTLARGRDQGSLAVALQNPQLEGDDF